MLDADAIADEMRQAIDGRRWNLAARRAQEVVELVVKGLLSEMGVDYPRTHDPAPILIEELRRRSLVGDPMGLDWLSRASSRLASLRGPAFYQEIEVHEAEAREAADAAGRARALATDLLARLRKPSR
jgi:HEPN domain-containing protein